MNTVQAKRLVKLAVFLENEVPRKQFNYDTFLNFQSKHDGFGYEKVAPDLSCGTQACALGWAATMPAFKRLGLTIGASASGVPALVFNNTVNGFTPSKAIAAIFGDDSHELFYPSEYAGTGINATPKQVARRIRKHVKTYGFPEIAAS